MEQCFLLGLLAFLGVDGLFVLLLFKHVINFSMYFLVISHFIAAALFSAYKSKGIVSFCTGILLADVTFFVGTFVSKASHEGAAAPTPFLLLIPMLLILIPSFAGGYMIGKLVDAFSRVYVTMVTKDKKNNSE